jgi:hypothetical protein
MRRLLAAGGLAIAACTCWLLFSGAGSAWRATISAASSPSHPLRGIIALGHSGLTGENSDPQRPGEPALKNSWATGTNQAVDSIYQRLVAVRPVFRGHAVNEAFGGATAATLVGQATKALRVDPNPQLVVIEIIGTDIRCQGGNSMHYPVFGRQVKAALELIVRKAPHTIILLMSQVGQPLQISKAITGTAGVPAWSGSDLCSAFDPNHRLDVRRVTRLTGIIEGYESELAKVCATVPECRTDDGRAAHFRVRSSYYNYSSFDWHHFNVTGLGALARFVWPTVAKVLNMH